MKRATVLSGNSAEIMPNLSHTLPDVLRRRALANPHAPAIISEKRTLSYAELDRRASSVGNSLLAAGIDPRDHVCLLMANGHQFAEIFFGVLRIGAVACPLNLRLSAGELGEICRDSEAKHLIFSEGLEVKAEDICARRPGSDAVSADSLLAQGSQSANAELPSLEPFAADNRAVIVYTSGTTGAAKGVVFTHAQLLGSSLTMAPTLDMRKGDTHLLPVPMFHVGGLSFLIHGIHLGVPLAIPPRWDASDILNLIERHKVAHFFAVPTMLIDLLAASDLAAQRLDSVRWIMSGGAPVPRDLILQFDALGIPLLQTCGATETGGPGLVVDAANAAAKAGTVGRGFFFTDYRLVDEAGEEPAPNLPGELHLRGPHIASGYLNNSRATREVFLAGGWFRTGDIAVADQDGYVTLVDRKGNKIITGGENVYPAEVEKALSSLPGISDVAVIGMPDTRLGEIVTAVVVPASDEPPPTLEKLQMGCGELARYKIPRRLVLRDTLPRNATGKLLRTALLESVSAARDSPD